MSHHRNAPAHVEPDEEDPQYYTSMVMMASNYTSTAMRNPPRTRNANSANITKPAAQPQRSNNNNATQKKALQSKKVNTTTATAGAGAEKAAKAGQSNHNHNKGSGNRSSPTLQNRSSPAQPQSSNKNDTTTTSPSTSSVKSPKVMDPTAIDSSQPQVRKASTAASEETEAVEEKTKKSNNNNNNNDSGSIPLSQDPTSSPLRYGIEGVVPFYPSAGSATATATLYSPYGSPHLGPPATNSNSSHGYAYPHDLGDVLEEDEDEEEDGTVSDYDYDYYASQRPYGHHHQTQTTTTTVPPEGMLFVDEDELSAHNNGGVQVDISFPDPTTISTMDKDGVWSYRHNPYSRSVSTVVSQCSSVVSSSSSFVGGYTPPPITAHVHPHPDHLSHAPHQHHHHQQQPMLASSFCSERSTRDVTSGGMRFLGSSSRGSISGSSGCGCDGLLDSSFDSPILPPSNHHDHHKNAAGYGMMGPSATTGSGAPSHPRGLHHPAAAAQGGSSFEMLPRRMNSTSSGSSHHQHHHHGVSAVAATGTPSLYYPPSSATTTATSRVPHANNTHYDPHSHSQSHSPLLSQQSLGSAAGQRLHHASNNNPHASRSAPPSARAIQHNNVNGAANGIALVGQPTSNNANNNFIPPGNLQEQFDSIADQLDVEACTARGRQLLVHILRLRDAERSAEIMSKLLPSINVVALDSNGCHVARAIVENMPTSEVLHLIHGLYPSTIFRLCTSSQHTRRVVQAIFEHHHGQELTPLVEVLANDACRLAVTQQGCIVIMSVLSHATIAQKTLLLPPLMPILATLATDQYGNYVVQALFENREGLVTMEELNHAFGKHRVQHSCNKCASNVMEKLVSGVTGITRRHIVQEFVFDPLNCHTLLLDCYGNFVLQAIIKSSTEPAEFQVIYDTVVSYLPNSPYGQKIGAKLHAKYREIFQADPPPPPPPPSTATSPGMTAAAALPTSA